MTKSVKAPEWTEAQIKSIEELALKNGGRIDNDMVLAQAETGVFANKNAAKLRGKVVSMKLYKKADAPRKVGGETAKRKIETVRAIETILSQPKGSFDTLEKASKLELEALAKALISLSDVQEAEQEAEQESE